MKLVEHIKKLKELTHNSFNNQFSRLGVGVKAIIEKEKIPAEFHSEREKLEQILSNHLDETGTYEKAREKVLDELTFTLFNRIGAIKVMEAKMLFPEIITKRAEHGDRSFSHKAWLEEKPEMRNEELEGIRQFIIDSFNNLSNTIVLYHKNYPYAFLPHTIELNEIIDTFNQIEKDSDVGADIWQSDDILGWLYESYNQDKKQKHKDSKEKTEYDKVSLQSQVYTPRWVVQFLVDNSLGKLYLEMYPNSEIKNKYKIANAPETRVREIKPLHEIKLIDPASGSGNFLLYAFDFFYELYIDQIENYGADYDEDDIPELIIKNNIHGVDLDIRAIQLAQLGLFIKAKSKRRSIKTLEFNVVSSDFYLPNYSDVKYIFESGISNQEQKEMVKQIWGDLQNAYMFGSLIRIEEKLNDRLDGLFKTQKGNQLDMFTGIEVGEFSKFKDEFFKNLEKAVEKYSGSESSSFLLNNTKNAIIFLKILTTKYDVVTANPPYTDSSDFGTKLKEFIDKNYQKPEKFNINLYATFIKRSSELLDNNGKLAMIHPLTFMYIKTFEDVRKYILENFHINTFVDYGLSNLFGTVMVDPAFYVLEKGIKTQNKAWFISLDQYTRTPNEKFKKDFCLKALDNYINDNEDKHNYLLSQEKLKIIKSYPFIYWISDDFMEKFKASSVKDLLKNCAGLQTSNNNRFLRFWWEVEPKDLSLCYFEDNKKWVRYAKGGPSKKWYGNLWTVVNWYENGLDIKNFVKEKYRKTEYAKDFTIEKWDKLIKSWVVKNESFYFQEGVTYSASGSKGASYRLLPKNSMFDVGGSCIFPVGKYKNNNYVLSFLNSKLSNYIVNCLNPTVNTQVGDIERIPFVIPEKQIESIIENLAKNNVEIKKHLTEYSIVEPEYKQSPLIFDGFDAKKSISEFLNYENYLLTQVLINEAIINEKVFDVYDLTPQDKSMVLAKEGESIGSLPILKEAKEDYLSEKEIIKEFPLDNVFEYIQNLPEKEFTEEEKDNATKLFPSLYQNNNDLEEFCIKNNINPINVWYWFKEANIIPQQRMNNLAMEFLADMIRDILNEDNDGIVPLSSNSGEKTLYECIQEKFYEKGFSSAQFASFDNVLGKELNDYLNNKFFQALSDHLNLFMYLPKTPFIWHLTSGSEHGFDAYIIIYKWSRDKLLLLKSVYVEKRERALMNRQSDLAEDNTAKAQSEKDKIYKQLKEIEEFKAKIDDLLESGYKPILDDGVGKNIAPLQKRKMISYEVLNAGQLEKYLNADW